jgi:hypothetical protein
VPALRPRDHARADRGPGRPHLRRRGRTARELRGARPVLIARILIWNLYDSKTTLEELRQNLPELGGDDRWISNEAQERLGLISFADELPDVTEVRRLIGKDPEVAEEFDVE